jgi:hypothetical protein
METELLSTLKSMQTEEEKYQYLLDCMPTILEYTKTTNSQSMVASSVFDVKKTIMSKKGDVYKNFKNCTVKPTSVYIINCEYCNSANVYYCTNSGDDVCTDCCRAKLAFECNMDYKDEKEMDKNIVYSYKRENHFNEWINQFQAKEITNIPPKLIDDLKTEIQKQKIKKTADITHKKIKEFLKKLKYSKYYEHIPYITTILNGTKPPVMTRELETKLRSMFHMIQKPFDKACPDERTNFLSYSYVLYKFCELLGEDDYLQFFPLLKSREKLYKHDQIWKHITAELHWEYIPTI